MQHEIAPLGSAPGYLKAREYADGDYETYKGMLVVAFDGKPTIHKVR